MFVFFVSVFDNLIVVKCLCASACLCVLLLVCLSVHSYVCLSIGFLLVSFFSFLLVYKAVWIFEYLFFCF